MQTSVEGGKFSGRRGERRKKSPPPPKFASCSAFYIAPPRNESGCHREKREKEKNPLGPVFVSLSHRQHLPSGRAKKKKEEEEKKKKKKSWPSSFRTLTRRFSNDEGKKKKKVFALDADSPS